MSEESTPPPLRLKPRMPADSPAPSSAPPPEPTPNESPAPKLRLKPKLSAEPPAAPEASPTPDVAAPPAIRLKPRVVAEPPSATASSSVTPPEASLAEPPATPAPPSDSLPAEPPKFKLKIKPPETVSSGEPPPAPVAAAPSTTPDLAPPSPPLASPVVNPAGAPPPLSVIAPASAAPAKKFPPPPSIPHVRAPAGAREEDLVPAASPPGRRKPAASKKFLLLSLVFTVLLAAAGGYYFFLAPNDAPSIPTPQKPRPTPSETLNKLAALPAGSINKTTDVIAARRDQEQDRIDALATGEDAPADRSRHPEKTVPASIPTPATVTSSAEVAPGIVATTTRAANVAGDASPAFRTWTANARISGVFQGNPPRALINGRTFRVGQTVDETLGIVFGGIDSDAKTIEFRDGSGATISRRY